MNKQGEMTFGTKTNNEATSSFGKAMRAQQEKLNSLKKDKSDIEEEIIVLKKESEEYQLLSESKILNLEETVIGQNENIAELQEENRMFNQSIEELQEEYQKLIFMNDQYEQNYKLQNENFSKIENDWNTREDDYKESQKEMEMLHKRLAQSHEQFVLENERTIDENDKIFNRNEALESENDSLKNKIKFLESSRMTIEELNFKMNKELKLNRDNLDKIDTENEVNKISIKKLENAQEKKQTAVDQLQKDYDFVCDKNLELENDKKVRIAERQKQTDQFEDYELLVRKNEDTLSKSYSESINQIDGLKKKLFELEKDNTQFKSYLESKDIWKNGINELGKFLIDKTKVGIEMNSENFQGLLDELEKGSNKLIGYKKAMFDEEKKLSKIFGNISYGNPAMAPGEFAKNFNGGDFNDGGLTSAGLVCGNNSGNNQNQWSFSDPEGGYTVAHNNNKYSISNSHNQQPDSKKGNGLILI